MPDLPVFIASAAGLAALVGMAEGMRAWLRWRSETVRRIVHALVGLWVAATPWLFEGPEPILLLAAGFALLNIVAVRRMWFKGMHAIRRRSWGTVTFPLALMAALFLTWFIDAERTFALTAAFAVMGLADPAASLVGMSLRRPKLYRIGHEVKSWAGTLTFAVVAFAACWAGLQAHVLWHGLGWASEMVLAASAAVAVTAAIVEGLGTRGWDNFFVVLCVLVVLHYADTHPAAADWLLVSSAVALAFASLAYALRFLDLSGAFAAGLLAFSVLGLGGLMWTIPGMVYFFGSSLLSKWRKGAKQRLEAKQTKGSRRDAGQVYANGGIAWAALILYVFVPHTAFYWMYLAAFAAAAADTWSTEIGTAVQGRTRSVTTFRVLEPGRSGGISLAGTLGGVAGALSVWIAAALVGWQAVSDLGVGWSLLLVVGGGVAGGLIDSLAGATVQALYWDEQAQAYIEAPPRMGRIARGYRWIDNDAVNLICTLSGAILALAGYVLR
ncbi:MAG: DUF92 domain-containing protein [Bacteroidota bacterium]